MDIPEQRSPSRPVKFKPHARNQTNSQKVPCIKVTTEHKDIEILKSY